MTTSTNYHVTVYLGGNPLMGRLFKVVAPGDEQARQLALKEAKAVLCDGPSPSELREQASRVIAKSDVVVGRPGHNCACAECDKPLSQILKED